MIYMRVCDKHEFFQPVEFCRFLENYKKSFNATNDSHADKLLLF